MPYTPKLQLPYVTGSDTPNSYPSVSQDLASKLEADQKKLLGFAENLTANTTSTGAAVDISGVTITFTLAKATFVVCTVVAFGLNSDAANTVAPAIQVAGFKSTYPTFAPGRLAVSGGPGQAFGSASAYAQLAAGSYTVKAQVINKSTGTAMCVGAQIFAQSLGLA